VCDNARNAHLPGRIDVADGDAVPAAASTAATAASTAADDDDLPERNGRSGWDAVPDAASAAAASAGTRWRTGLSLGTLSAGAADGMSAAPHCFKGDP
jgi:hypothetical protein